MFHLGTYNKNILINDGNKIVRSYTIQSNLYFIIIKIL